MILGHSETPPLPADFSGLGRALVFPDGAPHDVLSVFFPFRLYLDPTFCRLLAERGDALLQRDVAVNGVIRGGLHWRDLELGGW